MFPSGIGDAAEEFQELGRADDGVRDAGGHDQSLLSDLGAEIAIRSGQSRRWIARRGGGRLLRPPPGEGCALRPVPPMTTILFHAAVAAGSPTGFWRMSGHPAVQQALRNPYFDGLGLPRLYVPVHA